MLRLATLALAVLCSVVLGPSARALDDADRQAMRGVIERQIEAFRSDDGAAAYALAAPAIQRLFPDETIFMRMVREGYRPVYRPKAYSFGEAAETPAGPAQSVVIEDEDGAEWVALYSFERQEDGRWRISGCTLVKRPGQAA